MHVPDMGDAQTGGMSTAHAPTCGPQGACMHACSADMRSPGEVHLWGAEPERLLRAAEAGPGGTPGWPDPWVGYASASLPTHDMGDAHPCFAYRGAGWLGWALVPGRVAAGRMTWAPQVGPTRDGGDGI